MALFKGEGVLLKFYFQMSNSRVLLKFYFMDFHSTSPRKKK